MVAFIKFQSNEHESMQTSSAQPNPYVCNICGYQTEHPAITELGNVRGNTERFCNTQFQLWKCPRCLSIHSLDPVDFSDIYADYPLNNRKLDIFARGTLNNLLKRLKHAGLNKNASILDYGCGSGLFIQFLQEKGYSNVHGYDPFIEQYAAMPHARKFDCIVANDVIEHVPDPHALVTKCADMVKPGGLVYIGTADSEPVDMTQLETHIMRLHQPYHRVIITQKTLEKLGTESGLHLVRSFRRSYMDTFMPFSNYRFLDEFNKALGHNMDLALKPDSGKIVLKKPGLLFYALFGYLFPSAYEPAILLRKPT